MDSYSMLSMRRRDFLELVPVAGALLGLPGSVLLADESNAMQNVQRRWWKEAVVYQIYPRSFVDTNGDGIGDLPGITAKLDHLQALGIDVVWLSPHFDSPNADNGYDVRDYRKVMTEFGTMADFDRMLAEMKKRGIRLIIDLVVNHSSDEHAWFVESRKSRDNPYRDYYIWRDGRGEGPPNNYPSFFGGPAWTRDAATGQYYLHYFAAKQPDLNWDNPKVRAAVYDIMRFWLDKGVSGFRMDVIPFISKPPGLPDLTPAQLEAPQYSFAMGPKLHDYLQEMHREALGRYDTMTVGEAYGVTPEDARTLVDSRRGELNMAFNFDIIRMDHDGWRKKPRTLQQMKTLYAKLDREVGEFGWNTAFLCNHDNPRAVSHFGDDDPTWHERSAKTLATLLLTQRATPFLYQGDEIGMANYPFRKLSDFQDLEVHGEWRDLQRSGAVSEATYIENLRHTSRDNARTPMQWAADAKGGFTTGEPWLPVNPNCRSINVADQNGRVGSVLEHHRRLIALRKRTPTLVYGEYHDLDPDHPSIFAYLRKGRDDAFLVLLNFGRQTIEYPVPPGVKILEPVLMSNADDTVRFADRRVTMPGWQGLIFSCKV